jgi:hypothetical protein
LSAASIYPFNKSHSTHTHTPPCGGGGGMGERALPPPPAVAWPQIVYMVIVPQHTHTDIHIIVCEALMCCRCRCVGRSVGCVCVLCMDGLVVAHTHTRYSGLCCCSALLAAPLHREAAARHARSIQLCRVCAWTRSHIYIYGVCVCLAHTHTHPRHHQPSPTPTRMHMSSRACIPKVICICVNTGTVYTPNYYNTLL